jgi:hypothetical protein
VELLRADIQSLTRGSGTSLSDRAITTALADQLVIRIPLTIGTVCDGGSGSAGAVYLPAPGGGISNARVSGWGYTNTDESGTTDWVFTADTWTTLNVGGGTPKATCFTAGADTIGGGNDYYSLSGSVTSAADDGELFALFTEVELTIDDSGLRPGTKALFRREGTGSLVEFASGLTANTAFAYRRDNQTAFQSSVTNANQLSTIAELRLTIEAERQDQVSGSPSTYEWVTRIPLRNAGN